LKQSMLSPVKPEQAKLLLNLKTKEELWHEKYKAASEKKQCRQEVQAEKMKKWWINMTIGLDIGSIMALKMDYCDVSHAWALVGIVFDISKSDAGGIQVVTEYGVIAGSWSSMYYIPSDHYIVKSKNVVISDELELIKESVISGTFDASKVKRVTMQVAHRQMTGHSPSIRKGYNCKNRCMGRCGCMRGNLSCMSKCRCNSACQNPHNDTWVVSVLHKMLVFLIHLVRVIVTDQ
jgi:hypothetical protein